MLKDLGSMLVPGFSTTYLPRLLALLYIEE
jgi:hypothetical protein